MAYPSVSAPYGLVPIGLVGGRDYVGAIRQIPIASAYGTAMFNGDIVKLVTGGTIEKDTGTSACTPVGIFLGCFFTDSTMGPRYQNYWPASQAASDAVGYVVDDPEVLFKVAVLSSGTTISSLARTDVGANLTVIQNAGSTVNGRSKVGVDDTSATTNTYPVRVIDLVDETVNSSGGYTEAICKWNAGHQYGNTTGV